MGLLTVGTPIVRAEIDKDQVIKDIKEGLDDLPEWVWFTSPDYIVDLILMRSKTVNEASQVFGSVWTQAHQKTESKTYQIVYGVDVGESEYGALSTFCGVQILCVSSARELFKILRKHD